MLTFDAVVIGAGVAGLGAALEGAARGLRVAVVDAGQRLGGTAAVAGGGAWIAGSPLQRAHGIEDDAERGLQDWLAWGGPTVDRTWAERYITNSPVEVYDYLASQGVQWSTVQQREGDRVPRRHAPVGGGRAVMEVLQQAARREPGITWFLGTGADSLITQGAAVTGVYTRGLGRVRELRARSVLLASGGFCGNHTLVRRHAESAAHAERVLVGGGTGALGAGMSLLAEVGAHFTQLDAIWMYPTGTPDPQPRRPGDGLALRGLEGDLWINRDGVRFHDESLRGGGLGTRALLAQPSATCWTIFDARLAAQYYVADPRYRRGLRPIRSRQDELLRTSPFARSASTLAELATQIGVDPGQLVDIVRAHGAPPSAPTPTNDRGASRVDPALDQPPYHAVQMFPLARKNLGGVRTDDCGQVLRHSDLQAIPGLLAAGEVAGMAGGRISGRAALEGTMLGASLYSGRVAGRVM